MTNPIGNRQSTVGNPSVLAVIMARAGSVGLPGKSLRPLLGRPVITYTFDHARQSKLITRTVVSSDDPAILQLAKDSGFETIARPPELATATSATDPVLRHAVRTLYGKDGTAENTETTEKPKSSKLVASSSVSAVLSVVQNVFPVAIVMLYGNVPIRNNSMIDRAIQLLFDTNADSVQTIAPVGKFHPYWMFDRTPDGKITKHIPNNVFRRQDLPPLFSPTGAVYVMKTSVLMAAEKLAGIDPHAFLGLDRRGLIVDSEDSVDIDTPKDLFLAEAVLRAGPA